MKYSSAIEINRREQAGRREYSDVGTNIEMEPFTLGPSRGESIDWNRFNFSEAPLPSSGKNIYASSRACVRRRSIACCLRTLQRSRTNTYKHAYSRRRKNESSFPTTHYTFSRYINHAGIHCSARSEYNKCRNITFPLYRASKNE